MVLGSPGGVTQLAAETFIGKERSFTTCHAVFEVLTIVVTREDSELCHAVFEVLTRHETRDAHHGAAPWSAAAGSRGGGA